MGNFVMQAWQSDKNAWMAYASRTAPVGGDPLQTLPSTELAKVVSQWATHLVIDGIALRITAVGNTTGYVYLGIGECTVAVTGFHYIGSFSVAAGVPMAVSYAHLGIPYILPSRLEQFVSVNCLIAEADTSRVSIWGHYQPVEMLPEPQEVTVKGVQFFPKRKVSGPV